MVLANSQSESEKLGVQLPRVLTSTPLHTNVAGVWTKGQTRRTVPGY